jgi:hypothetical protein
LYFASAIIGFLLLPHPTMQLKQASKIEPQHP